MLLVQVMLKMKSKHVAGTITKKKKSEFPFAGHLNTCYWCYITSKLPIAGVIIEVCKDIQAWPGRHLLEGCEQRRYFGLRTVEKRVIEFECRSRREYDMWTQGVTRLLNISKEKKHLA